MYSDNNKREISENRMLRRIFGHKQEKVIAQQRKIHAHEFIICPLSLILE
jgi:hypothetical protein